MKKIVIGLAALVVLAAAGYFGFLYVAQSRAAAGVETAFAGMRSSGAKASHGTISYDPWKRTISIADIATETATQPPTTVKIANLTASGVSQPEQGRMTADLLEATDIDVSFTLASGGAQLQYNYRLPKLTASDFSGPAQVEQLPAGASTIDVYRFGLEQFTRIAASSVTIPNLSVGVKLNSAVLSGGDVGYSGITIEGIKDGKVATARVDKGALAYNMQLAGKNDGFGGTFTHLAVHDFDATAVAAVLDPQKANDDRSYRMYRQVSIDGYDVKSAPDLHMRFDHVVVDDLAVRPSRLQLPALIAALPMSGTKPTPAQARETVERLATIYEGLHLGNFGVSGITVDTQRGPVTVAAAHFSMDNGKSEFGIDGLDAQTPQGPLRAGHFLIKSIDLSKLMRISATMQQPEHRSPNEAALALLQIFGGAEVKDLVAPYKDTGKPINVDNLDIGWGAFVGPIPTQAHINAKLTAPVAASDPVLRPLLAAAMQTAQVDADLGAGWTESSGTLELQPATLEIAGLGKAQARIVLANVPRALFAEPLTAGATAAQIETGALELTLHDGGGVDLLVDQYAHNQNLSRDAARSALIEAIKTNGAQAAGVSPDAAAAMAAIGQFVQTPQQTLVIRLTPIGKLPAMQLLQLVKSDPMAALAQFRIEASTGL
ncbi:MAG TPA: hypothetical protein VKY22_29730 [Bradyrhizobium sp.]|nr:hypothetical protein [Bradyrhizobium sp.]